MELALTVWHRLKRSAEAVVYLKHHALTRRLILALPDSLTANTVTALRLALALPLLFCLLTDRYWLALAVFALAAVGDALDGMIAEARDQKTTLGAFLDPLADKVVNLTVLLALVPQLSPAFWPVVVAIALFGLGNTVGRIAKLKLATPERPANILAVTASKVKFHLECYGVIVLLVAVALSSSTLTWLAFGLLALSLPFAFFSFLAQVPRRS